MALERKYSDDVRTRAVARVVERRKAEPGNRAIIREVATEFEVGEQSLRQWLTRLDDRLYDFRRAPADAAATRDDADIRVLVRQIESLQREVALLRDENRVLKRASSIFAADLISHWDAEEDAVLPPVAGADLAGGVSEQ